MDHTGGKHAVVDPATERAESTSSRSTLDTMPTNTTAGKPRFCSDCGTQLNADALFCHSCGLPIHGSPAGAPAAKGVSDALRWGVPAFAVGALAMLTFIQFASGRAGADDGAVPLSVSAAQSPDISSMSPEVRADHLFNRVMRLSSEGKADSTAFFGPMALVALEALTPLNAHRRYDMGLVALVTGDVSKAKAQGDAILAQHRTHLLGLSLAARAADVRGDAVAAKAFRQRLLAAESAERARALPEYTDHDADIRTAVELARRR